MLEQGRSAWREPSAPVHNPDATSYEFVYTRSMEQENHATRLSHIIQSIAKHNKA